MNIEQTVLRSPRTPSHNHSHNIIGFVWLLNGGLRFKMTCKLLGTHTRWRATSRLTPREAPIKANISISVEKPLHNSNSSELYHSQSTRGQLLMYSVKGISLAHDENYSKQRRCTICFKPSAE